MRMKVLVAVDLSENSLRAVDYIGLMLTCQEDAQITMLHVIKEPSPDVMPDPKARENYVARVRSETLALMEQASERLTSRGIPEANVLLKIEVCKRPVSVAELILHEQQCGGYTTVVVGRRGVSKKEEFLFGSVSNTVVREAKQCAVWVVE